MRPPLLKSAIELADRHSSILATALHDLDQEPPLTADLLLKDDPQLLRLLDQIQSRFTKLQDHLGNRLFPALLDALAEDASLSMLDRLERMEKLGYLDSSDTWLALRATRNRLAHDYPSSPEELVAEMVHAVQAAKTLVVLWGHLRARIAAHPTLRTAVE